jgi:predicted acylesterase/phospholipase RssA
VNGELSSSSMVLSGGASSGAYEVGVMLALFQGESPVTGGRPLEVNQFAGTSIGGYNAAAMVAGAEQGLAAAARRLCRIWLEEVAQQPGSCDNGVFRVRGGELLNVECLLRPTSIARVIRDGGFFLQGLGDAAARFAQMARPLRSDALARAVLAQIDVSALVDVSPFRALIRRTVPLDSLLGSGLELKLVAANFETGEANVFEKRDIVDRVGHAAILASSALPGVFPPVYVDGSLHVDGGAMMNTPLIPAVHGSDTLHAVYMDPFIENISIQDLQSTVGAIDRMVATSFAYGMNQDIDMIFDFNRSLELIRNVDRAAASDSGIQSVDRAGDAVAEWVRVNGDFAPATIHRYHPSDDLGGALGFLDLSYDRIVRLIERGYRDAVAHDCTASRCVFAQPAISADQGRRR